MRDRLPGLMAIGLLVLLVLITWWAADYTQRAIDVDPARRLTHEPDAWAERFVMLRSDLQGVVINRMEGTRLLHYPDDDSYEILEIHGISRQADTPTITGTATHAVMDQDGDRVTLQGNAHVHRSANAQSAALDLRGDALTWLIPQDVVHTDTYALVERGQSTMEGIGMHYSNKTRILQVQSSTRVRLAAPDQRSTRQETAPPAPADDPTTGAPQGYPNTH